MKRLAALASMLVLAGSVGVATLFASSGATGAGAADPSFAPSGLVPTGTKLAKPLLRLDRGHVIFVARRRQP